MANTAGTGNQNESSGSRFSLWAALTSFSVVVLADIASSTKYEDERTRPQQWAMSVACISLSLGTLSMVAHALARNRFVATPIEGGLITLCLGFWVSGLPSIMNPANGVAVDGGLGSPNLKANVYFFSWGAFAVSLLLAGSFAREVVEVQLPQNFPKRALWWYALCAASFVVMATASRTFHLGKCGDLAPEDEELVGPCKRVKFGIALGVISAAFTIVMGSISHLLPVVVESIAALVMMILWCVGVGFITFGSKAPASNVGNFYFSSWASFIIALFLVSDAITETYGKLRGDEGNDQTTTPTKETQPEAGSSRV